jgi:hypothetical protein
MLQVLSVYVERWLNYVFDEATRAEEDAIEDHQAAAEASYAFHERRIDRIARARRFWLGLAESKPAAAAPAPAPAAAEPAASSTG